MQAVNQYTLEGIQKSAEERALRRGGKELSIPEGNLVLFQDHPEGHNIIQNQFKDQKFVMFEWLCKPNVYHSKPVNGDDLEQIVNCQQLQDLQRAHDDSDISSEEEMGEIPSFNPRAKLK